MSAVLAAGLVAASDDGGSGWAVIALFVIFALAVIEIAAMWRIFTKAGEEGWKVIIPIYNIYILCKISGRPGWWVVLLLIPFVGFIVWIVLMSSLSKSFGEGTGFTLGLVFLQPIFVLILGFGDSRYVGPGGQPVGVSFSPPPPPPPPATA